MGKYKEISIEQSNWPSVGRMKLKEPYIDLEKIYIEFENKKISLKEYINKTNNRIYLIKPKDRLHLWGWIDFREKIDGRLLEYATKDNRILYQIIETKNEINLSILEEFDLYIDDILK